MAIHEMDRAKRRALLKGERDILSPAFAQATHHIPDCPRCSVQMKPKRPEKITTIVPKWDFVCPQCSGVLSGVSGLFV